MKKEVTRRTALKGIGVTVAAAASGIGFPAILKAADTVKVGFAGPFTGMGATVGPFVRNCFELAVEEINAQGGAGGRRIEYLVEDTKSTTKGTIDSIRKLIGHDKVDVLMGLVYSLERQAALSVSARAKKLLIYPTFYEGGECEKYLVCTGQVPNQSIDKFVPWLTKKIGKSVYIMGSDYIWPRNCTKAIKAAFETSGGTVVGEAFFPFGTQDFAPALQDVKAANPDMLWHMVVGADSITFTKQYRSFNLKPQLVSNAVDEMWATYIPGEVVAGIISNMSYFMTLDTPVNKAFVANYKKKFGPKDQLVPALAEAMYCGTWLYAKAVAKAGSTDDDKVISAISQVEFDAPQGLVNISPVNQHMVCNSIAAKARADGLFDILEHFGQIEPEVPGCKLA
jgi:urea transport system substrate-binding protein